MIKRTKDSVRAKGYKDGGLVEAQKTMAREFAIDDKMREHITSGGKPYRINQDRQMEEALAISDAVPRRKGK
jgi:uncharacterized protein YllA (UPF0747 family)